MDELLALEYRQRQWSSPMALASRVARVADACAKRQVAAVGLAGLMSGQPTPLRGTSGSALLFGFRLETVDAAIAVGQAIGKRGFTGIYSWTDRAEREVSQIPPSFLAGWGLLHAYGGDQVWVDASPVRVRKAMKSSMHSAESLRPLIWMPAPDRFERAIDGVFLDEATRSAVNWVWVPGSGINRLGGLGGPTVPLPVIEAWHDDGTRGIDNLARWVLGDKLQRGKMRLATIGNMPRRWLRGVIEQR